MPEGTAGWLREPESAKRGRASCTEPPHFGGAGGGGKGGGSNNDQSGSLSSGVQRPPPSVRATKNPINTEKERDPPPTALGAVGHQRGLVERFERFVPKGSSLDMALSSMCSMLNEGCGRDFTGRSNEFIGRMSDDVADLINSKVDVAEEHQLFFSTGFIEEQRGENPLAAELPTVSFNGVPDCGAKKKMEGKVHVLLAQGACIIFALSRPMTGGPPVVS